MSPRFLSKRSVARFFDAAPATVDRWIAAGVIPPAIPDLNRGRSLLEWF